MYLFMLELVEYFLLFAALVGITLFGGSRKASADEGGGDGDEKFSHATYSREQYQADCAELAELNTRMGEHKDHHARFMKEGVFEVFENKASDDQREAAARLQTQMAIDDTRITALTQRTQNAKWGDSPEDTERRQLYRAGIKEAFDQSIQFDDVSEEFKEEFGIEVQADGGMKIPLMADTPIGTKSGTGAGTAGSGTVLPRSDGMVAYVPLYAGGAEQADRFPMERGKRALFSRDTSGDEARDYDEGTDIVISSVEDYYQLSMYSHESVRGVGVTEKFLDHTDVMDPLSDIQNDQLRTVNRSANRRLSIGEPTISLAAADKTISWSGGPISFYEAAQVYKQLSANNAVTWVEMSDLVGSSLDPDWMGMYPHPSLDTEMMYNIENQGPILQMHQKTLTHLKGRLFDASANSSVRLDAAVISGLAFNSFMGYPIIMNNFFAELRDTATALTANQLDASNNAYVGAKPVVIFGAFLDMAQRLAEPYMVVYAGAGPFLKKEFGGPIGRLVAVVRKYDQCMRTLKRVSGAKAAAAGAAAVGNWRGSAYTSDALKALVYK